MRKHVICAVIAVAAFTALALFAWAMPAHADDYNVGAGGGFINDEPRTPPTFHLQMPPPAPSLIQECPLTMSSDAFNNCMAMHDLIDQTKQLRIQECQEHSDKPWLCQ
jgi:hypothetical protein